METSSETTVLEIGRWIGQGQAFGLVASKCNAAQAQCLQSIRDQRLYETLALTWEDFCVQYAGISRAYADQLIRNLQEFGDAYFRLSQILHISDAAYREISGAVTGETIEVDGESIPIIPENAARIRQAIAQLRAGIRKAGANLPAGVIASLQARLDACFKEMGDFVRCSSDPGDQAALRGLVAYSIRKLQQIP